MSERLRQNKNTRMKKRIYIILLLLLALCNDVCFAAYEPRGRTYDLNVPDIGLPNGEEVIVGLLIGVLAIVIGQLTVRIKDNETMGCIGVLLHIVGVIALLPLIAWICAIGQLVIGIVIGLGVIVAIIALIFSRNKK